MKDLNEEINRIKSLFTEDRLYGNLINEACDCEDADMIGELEDEYTIYKKNEATTDCAGAGTKLEVIKKILDDKSEDYTIGKQQDRWCFLEYTLKLDDVTYRWIFYEDDSIVKEVVDYGKPVSSKTLSIGDSDEQNVNRIIYVGTYKTTDPTIPYTGIATKYRSTDNKTSPIDPVTATGTKYTKKFIDELN